LSLFLLASLVQAADVADAHLTDELIAAQERAGVTVFVGWVTFDAKEVAERAVAAGLEAELGPFARGDNWHPAMNRALRRTGLACGVRLTPAARDRWTVQLHGACGGGEGSGAALALTDELYMLHLERSLPQPGTAFAQSAVIGFGTGHFYADNPARGRLHLGLQIGGIGFSAGMAALAGVAFNGGDDPTPFQMAAAAGGAFTLGARVFDAIDAPYTAHASSLHRIDTLRAR